MILIGEFNTLKAKRQTDNGFYLICDEDDEVLLPNKYIPEDFAIGDLLEVFVYKDSEDRIVATTDEPFGIVGEYAYLKAKDITPIGAFMDWGLEKDLLVPFREQRNRIEANRSYIIHIYLDEQSGRIAGSNKYLDFVEDLPEDYKEGDEVELLIANKTDLGFNAIIDDVSIGLIFHNQVHQDLRMGLRMTGYIKTIREDGKVDLILQEEGQKNVDKSAKDILKQIVKAGGFLPLHDKSGPDEIKNELGVSKKTFKKAIGALYKNKMITIEAEGVRAV